MNVHERTPGRLRATLLAVMLAVLFVPPGAALSAVDVQPASLVAGDAGDVVVNFTTALPLSPLQVVNVTFPAGFDVSGATKPTDCTGATGDGILSEGIKTIGIVGQTLTLTYDGGLLDLWEAGAKSCTIGNITNPTTAGSTKSPRAPSQCIKMEPASGPTIAPLP